MTTLKELRALAKYYGIPGRSNLKKNDLIKAIADAEFIKRLQRAQKMGRHSAIPGDVENPHKKGRRDCELVQIKDEVDAALRANKYTTAVEKKPFLWQKPLKQITGRLVKPHLHGLTRSRKETLAQAIKREGADILKDFLDPNLLDPEFLDPAEYYALYGWDTLCSTRTPLTYTREPSLWARLVLFGVWASSDGTTWRPWTRSLISGR